MRGQGRRPKIRAMASMRPARPILRVTLAALLALAVLAAAGPSRPAAQTGATTCPGTFYVLHDDRIGVARLPAGRYRITLIDARRLSCAAAADLFRQFLEDFDGRLRRPWLLDSRSGTFRRGARSSVGFRVTVTSGTGSGSASEGGGTHPDTGELCPGFFRLRHRERIGSLAFAAGSYRLTLVSVGRVSCGRAARLFSQFLRDFDGRLPSPWFLDVETGTFLQGARNAGFRVKLAEGAPPSPRPAGTHPADGRLCTSSFRVQHNGRIGRLRLLAGTYLVTLLRGRGLTCAGASRQFRRFLSDPEGDLPRPWVMNVRSASFSRGRGSQIGFRVKPARAPRR